MILNEASLFGHLLNRYLEGTLQLELGFAKLIQDQLLYFEMNLRVAKSDRLWIYTGRDYEAKILAQVIHLKFCQQQSHHHRSAPDSWPLGSDQAHQKYLDLKK